MIFNKTTWKKVVTSLLLSAVVAVFASCSKSETKEEAANKASVKSAKLVYVNWAEGVAYTHLAQAVLEEKMGYDVELTVADVGPAYISIAQGDRDALMECWPKIQAEYIAKCDGKIEEVGTVYKGAEVGLVVPAYVTIDTIAELKDHKEQFKGVITGIDAGAGMMGQIEDIIIPDYDLGFKLMASSGPAMCAALGDAISRKEWIVVPGWKPHWMFGRWDLKLLKQDPDKKIWGVTDIKIMGRKGLSQDKPELAAFLGKMFMTDTELADLIVKVEDSDEDVKVVAREWMKNHPDVVDKWIPATK